MLKAKLLGVTALMMPSKAATQPITGLPCRKSEPVYKSYLVKSFVLVVYLNVDIVQEISNDMTSQCLVDIPMFGRNPIIIERTF